MAAETVGCDERGLERTAEVLLAGGVAAIPTDTVYGLAAHPGRAEAVARLYSIKGRERGKPIAFLAADAAAVAAAGFPLGAQAAALAARHWPGALTLVVESERGGLFEGFRVPDHDWTRRLLARCGGTLRVTSANLSGERPATDAREAFAEVGARADIVADGGPCPGGTASTVVKVARDGSLEILRQGPLAPLAPKMV